MINRENFAREMELRHNVRKAINIIKERRERKKQQADGK